MGTRWLFHDRRVGLLSLASGVLLALLLLVGWVLPLPDHADAVFWGETIYGQSGDHVALVGDVNGDGYDDILIAVPNGNVCYKQSGGAYLLLGRPGADWGADLHLGQADASFCGEDWSDIAGRGLAGAGDVNGDGLDDMLIGAPGYNTSVDIADAGKAYLILGRAEADWGLQFDLANADASFHGEAKGNNAGASVAGVGDVNGDGYDDLAIGAYLYDSPGLTDTGKIYLFLGRAAADWGPGCELGHCRCVLCRRECLRLCRVFPGWCWRCEW